MEQLTPDMFTHAQLDSGIIQCKCGNQLMSRVELNLFRDTPKDLFSKIKSINPTDNIDLLECANCGDRILPPIMYQSLTQKDLKLAKHLDKLVKNWNAGNEAPVSES